jgi:hypothetical protein
MLNTSAGGIHEVHIRVIGDVGLVRATGEWMRHDGTPGISRYTDIYVRHASGWRVVSSPDHSAQRVPACAFAA